MSHSQRDLLGPLPLVPVLGHVLWGCLWQERGSQGTRKEEEVAWVRGRGDQERPLHFTLQLEADLLGFRDQVERKVGRMLWRERW